MQNLLIGEGGGTHEIVDMGGGAPKRVSAI